MIVQAKKLARKRQVRLFHRTLVPLRKAKIFNLEHLGKN